MIKSKQTQNPARPTLRKQNSGNRVDPDAPKLGEDDRLARDKVAIAAKCAASRSAYLGLKQAYADNKTGGSRVDTAYPRQSRIFADSKPFLSALATLFPGDSAIAEATKGGLHTSSARQLGVYLSASLQASCALLEFPSFDSAPPPRDVREDCRIVAQHLADLKRLQRETDDESIFTDKSHLIARFNLLLETISQERIASLYLKGIKPAETYYWYADSKRQLLVDIEALADRLTVMLQTCAN